MVHEDAPRYKWLSENGGNLFNKIAERSGGDVGQQPAQEARRGLGAGQRHISLGGEIRRRLVVENGHRDPLADALSRESLERVECVYIGLVVAEIEGATQPTRADDALDCDALIEVERRA